ncbi:MAG: tetratricopeptide repeat protein [Acidobacteriaceae bacterium]
MPFLLVLFSAHAWARDSAPAWVEVRSPHFTVVTDAGEKEGRHVADQFERMRWVFQTLFPHANVDPAAPIMVIGVRNKQGMEALEPDAYRAKGQVNLAGLFLRNTDMNYILVRLDAQEEHPFAAVYHEYTHLELGIDGMPLWLNEGLAEFFQNTDIRDKDVMLGQASPDNILYLRQHRLIPLPVLFQVDANSPYYHEEEKGSVFYAESWALTHYLEVTDYKAHTNRIGAYLRLVKQQADPIAAAEQTFGDLKRLQSQLEDYITQGRYMYFHMNSAAAAIDPNTLVVTPLTRPQGDAIRADFLARSGRRDDARSLVEAVLKADANNAQAHETMGFIELRAGHHEEAKKWYAQAIALDPKSYVAQYYFGWLSLMGGTTGEEAENSLRKAIELNPRFAPAYDSLAVLYGRRHDKLDEAHMLALQAIQLDPGNVNYRLNTANILMEQEHYDDSLQVLRTAATIARTPLEVDVVQRVIKQVQQQEAEMEEAKHRPAEAQAQTTEVRPAGGSGQAGDEEGVAPKHPTETPHGQMHVVRGVIRGVTCSYPSVIQLRVENPTKKLSLYNNNYYKVDYSAANFTPKGDVHPCEDLEGTQAEVEYFVTADKTVDGQIVGIMMIK